MQGHPVRPATHAALRLGLERLASDAAAAFNRASVPGDETRAKTVRERPARERLVTAMMSADGRPREEAERLADRWIDGQAIHGSWLPEFAEPVRLAREEVKPCCDVDLGPGAGYCREHNPGGRVA